LKHIINISYVAHFSYHFVIMSWCLDNDFDFGRFWQKIAIFDFDFKIVTALLALMHYTNLHFTYLLTITSLTIVSYKTNDRSWSLTTVPMFGSVVKNGRCLSVANYLAAVNIIATTPTPWDTCVCRWPATTEMHGERRSGTHLCVWQLCRALLQLFYS